MPNSRLSDEDIDRIEIMVTEIVKQNALVARKTLVSGSVSDGGFRKLIDGLLILGVAALVAIVWQLSNNVSVLTTQVGYLNQEMQAIRAKP